jgi:hypothetical protein
MKIHHVWKVAALLLMAISFASCAKKEDASVAAADLPPGCEEFFRALTVCTDEGKKATSEEADKKYAELVKSFKSSGGGLSADDCKTALDAVKEFQKTGC